MNNINNIKPGNRIICICINDQFSNVKEGDKGTVIKVDDMGTIHVKWDNGSTIGLIPNIDMFIVEN